MERRVANGSRNVSIAEISKRLNIAPITIKQRWQTGTGKRRPLPTTRALSGKQFVNVQEAELLAWLREYRPDLAARWLSGLY